MRPCCTTLYVFGLAGMRMIPLAKARYFSNKDGFRSADAWKLEPIVRGSLYLV